LNVPCIGVISEDERILRQNNSGVPFVYQSSFTVTNDIKLVAEKLINKKKSIHDKVPASKTIWEKMKNNAS
jgi:septum formation inhibitor-activating ATPase MinD